MQTKGRIMMNAVKQKIEDAKKIAIFSHILPDGDSVGSTLAMQRVLTQSGKKAVAYIDGKIPHRLQFLCNMADEGCLDALSGDSYDLLIALDCGDAARTGIFSEYFLSHPNTICIDHHISNAGFAGVNVIIPHASSTGEILAGLFNELGYDTDNICAGLLYASIASDSGCFMFSNTTPKTHILAAELMEKGADYERINKLLFATMEAQAVKIRGYAMNNIEYYCGGRVAVVLLTAELLEGLGVSDEHTEGLTDIPRNVEGVEVGIVIREYNGRVKVSLRTNSYVDAAHIAGTFGGGGHKRAAGCTSDEDIYRVRDSIIDAVTRELDGKD